jgi:hypothetical protein
MNRSELNVIVKGLNRTERMIYREAKKGLVTAAGVREQSFLKTGGGDWSGMTDAFRKLESLGLLRKAGLLPKSEYTRPDGRPKSGKPPMRYERVPLAEIDAAREAYRPPKPLRRVRRETEPTIADLRRLEVGDYDAWWREWRHVWETADRMEQRLAQMIFWKLAPEDEQELVDKALDRMEAAIKTIREHRKQRLADDRIREKIEKLDDHRNGAEPGEVRNAERLARKLRGKLPS